MNVIERGMAASLIWVAAAPLVGCGGGGDEGNSGPTALTCEQLAGMAIPASAIGLPTSGGAVTSATVTARRQAAACP